MLTLLEEPVRSTVCQLDFSHNFTGVDGKAGCYWPQAQPYAEKTNILRTLSDVVPYRLCRVTIEGELGLQ